MPFSYLEKQTFLLNKIISITFISQSQKIFCNLYIAEQISQSDDMYCRV